MEHRGAAPRPGALLRLPLLRRLGPRPGFPGPLFPGRRAGIQQRVASEALRKLSAMRPTLEGSFERLYRSGKLSPRSTQCTPLHRSLISKFPLKIAEFFAFFPKFRKFGQILLNFHQISPSFSGFLQNAAFFLKDLILAAK